MPETIYSYGLLALELCPGRHLGRPALDVAAAGRLGELLAADLKPWLGARTDIDISLAAAAFDPTEVLRPGWPLHAEIARLAHLAPKSPESRLLCLGSHDGAMPPGLQPDPDYLHGPLRWIPYVLSGPASALGPVQDHMEAELMERGMAGAGTALFAQEAFDTAIEHARLMTLHDGVAMMAMQYGHNGLEPVWPLIETALFAPEREAWLDAAPEPLVYLARGTAHIALLDAHQWARLQPALDGVDCEQLERRFQMFEMRQRQIAALLTAHGLTVEFDFCPDADTARAVLRG
jgi:hypothetical protein